MARKRKKAPEGASQKWMLTFSDMMTLLLTFFVLLFSMSSTDSANLRKAFKAMQSALSVMELGTLGLTRSQIPIKDAMVTSIKPGHLMAAVNELRRFLTEEELNDKVAVHKSERGIVLSISESVVFEQGSAVVKEGSYPLLHMAARLATRLAKTIRVEGNTDSTPVTGGQFKNNLELSAHRAANVLGVILEEGTFTPHGASIGALGEYNAVYPDEASENEKRANRRVEVYIIDPPDVESFWYALMRSYLNSAKEELAE